MYRTSVDLAVEKKERRRYYQLYTTVVEACDGWEENIINGGIGPHRAYEDGPISTATNIPGYRGLSDDDAWFAVLRGPAPGVYEGR